MVWLPKFVRTSVFPSLVTRISRGKSPEGIDPTTELAPALTFDASMTLSDGLSSARVPPNRFELVTTTARPLSTTATPTGDVPTGTVAIKEWPGSPTSFSRSKTRTALLFRALTYVRLPAGERTSRTELQPAPIA